MKIFIPLVSLFLSLQSFAVVVLDPPSDLVKKASLGQIELREVIMDLQLNASEFTTPQQFDPYFSILPELERLAKVEALDEIFPEAVKKLGITMTTNGIRWLDIVQDSPKRLKFYHDWMDENVAYRFQTQVELRLAVIKDLGQLKAAAANIEKLIPELESLFPKNVILAGSYRRLTSETALKIIHDQQLSEDEVLFWLSKVLVPASFVDYFDFLRQEIRLINEANKDKMSFVLKRIIVISGQIEKNKQNNPSWIREALGEVLLETLIKYQQFELPLSNGQYQLLLKGMQAQHVRALSQYYQSVEKTPNTGFSKTYLEWLRVLDMELRVRNLFQEVDNLSRYFNQISAPIMAKVFDIEGSYELKDSEGQEWILTLVIAKSNMLIASLGTVEGDVYKTYFNSYYSLAENKFVSSFREADRDPSENPVIKFSINKKNQIQVEDLFSKGSTNILVGTRFEKYPTYQEHQSRLSNSIDGIYAGMIHFPKSSDVNMRLIISNFSGYSLARLTDNSGLDLEFNIGSRAEESPVYLTTGKLPSGAWVHLRIYKVSDKELCGYVIGGGRGKAAKEFRLRKIN